MKMTTENTKKKASPSENISARNSALRRTFGTLEVVEAKEALHIQPTRVDIKGAERDDPANCALSRACQRMYDSKVVLFFGTIAYVDLLDEHGQRKIVRFRIGPAAQEFIKAFDAGDDVCPGGFRLSPSPPAATLDGAAQQRRRRRARRREALLKGEVHVPDARFRHEGMNRPSAKRFSNFRNGAGMVHFPPASA